MTFWRRDPDRNKPLSLWQNFETEEAARTRRALRAVNSIHSRAQMLRWGLLGLFLAGLLAWMVVRK